MRHKYRDEQLHPWWIVQYYSQYVTLLILFFKPQFNQYSLLRLPQHCILHLKKLPLFCSIVWFEAFVSHGSSFNILSAVADIFLEIDIWLVWTVHLEWQQYNPSCYTNKYIMSLFYTRWSDPSTGYWLVVTARCPPGLWHFRSECSGGNQVGDTVGSKISPSDFCLEGQCESHLDWLGCRQGGGSPASTTMHFRWCNVKAANTVDSIRSGFLAVKVEGWGQLDL